PTWLDFLCILIGILLSLLLVDWSDIEARGTDITPPPVIEHLLHTLPALLFMPVGVLAFWPLFFLTQWLRGREEPLSSGEWLWCVAWLTTLPLVVAIAWPHWMALPESA